MRTVLYKNCAAIWHYNQFKGKSGVAVSSWVVASVQCSLATMTTRQDEITGQWARYMINQLHESNEIWLKTSQGSTCLQEMLTKMALRIRMIGVYPPWWCCLWESLCIRGESRSLTNRQPADHNEWICWLSIQGEKHIPAYFILYGKYYCRRREIGLWRGDKPAQITLTEWMDRPLQVECITGLAADRERLEMQAEQSCWLMGMLLLLPAMKPPARDLNEAIPRDGNCAHTASLTVLALWCFPVKLAAQIVQQSVMLFKIHLQPLSAIRQPRAHRPAC